MNRRNAMRLVTGAIVGSSAGLFSLSMASRPKNHSIVPSGLINYNSNGSEWNYSTLDPDSTAQMAYNFYSEGSCMYATVKGIISQLAEKYGEPYASFPVHMFKYGHGGIGGYGSVCGALNGAAAIMGLLISDKAVLDLIITDLFQWYENEPFPTFKPSKAIYDYVPVMSTSNSILCHASNTNWCKVSGFTVGSNERKERCRRLVADVAKMTTISLNQLTNNEYKGKQQANDTTVGCISCHSEEGKVKNTSVKMSCKSCHPVAHQAF
ncbi:MAG TPA: C-GCAxxG-C-C family protein [Mariniphaga sp.]|nr:C-GCAxxG-C-C family protein [Mariniphaga sp.]